MIATHPEFGAFVTFDGTVDDWANYDPVRHASRDYRLGWQDSFLRLTGYRANLLPFEFIRRLAWRLANCDGYFAGLVVHMTDADPAVDGYYDAESRVAHVPLEYSYEPYWQRVVNGSVFFPRAIEDIVPIVNEACRGAFIYLGTSDRDGAICLVEEDDEWFVQGDPIELVPAIEDVARAMGLPVAAGEFNIDSASAVLKRIPRISIVNGEVIVSPRK